MAVRSLRASFALVAGLGVVATALVTQPLACSSSSDRVPTALYLGVSSDMVVEDDFDSIGLFVSVNGDVKLSNVSRVRPNGTVALPGSISILQPVNPSTPVHIRVVGYKSGTVIAVRDAISTVPPDQISVLRLPIQWLSGGPKVGGKQRTDGGPTPSSGQVKLKADPVGSDPNFPEFARFFEGLVLPCPAGQTPVNGTCSPLDVTNLLIPTKGGAHVAEVFGGATGVDGNGVPAGGACFPVEDCFADALAIPLADVAADCSIPKGSVPIGQVNFAVRRKKCTDTRCSIVFDYVSDPNRTTTPGWFEQNGRYVLPEATCDVEGRRADVEAILVSTTCKNKVSAIPTCGPWSAVSDKMQRPPPVGPYLADGGVTGWRPTRLRTITSDVVSKPVGLALGSNRFWVVGRDGKAAGFSRSTDLAPLTFGPTSAVVAPVFPSIAAKGTFVATGVGIELGDARLLRFSEPVANVDEKILSGVTLGNVVLDDDGNPILTYTVLPATMGTPGIKVATQLSQMADEHTAMGPLLADLGSSYFLQDGSRTLYLTVGLRLHSMVVPRFGQGNTQFTTTIVASPPFPFNQSGGPGGVFATSKFIFWQRERPAATTTGNPTFAILRNEPSTLNVTARPWVENLTLSGAQSSRDIPAMTGDENSFFFSDGKNVYGRKVTDSEISTPPAPLYTTDPGDFVFGLAYDSSAGALYAVTENGLLLGGPVTLK